MLDPESIARHASSARRGAAAGASGMTAEDLRLVLESKPDTRAFCWAAQGLARVQVPPDVLALLWMGCLTTLQKSGGGVRGIVWDIVCRLVARTIELITTAVEELTSPFQYALATKAGEVAHAIQLLTDLDSRATVLSIDGISAFDLILGRPCWTACPT